MDTVRHTPQDASWPSVETEVRAEGRLRMEDEGVDTPDTPPVTVIYIHPISPGESFTYLSLYPFRPLRFI